MACGGISCALFYLYNGREQDPPLKPSGHENWVKMVKRGYLRPVNGDWQRKCIEHLLCPTARWKFPHELWASSSRGAQARRNPIRYPYPFRDV